MAALGLSSRHAGVRKYAAPGLAKTGTQKPKCGSTLTRLSLRGQVSLARRYSAVYEQHLARDESSRWRGEKDYWPDDIARLRDASERNSGFQRPAERGVVEVRPHQLGLNEGRRDPVDGDAMWRKLHRMLLHQCRQASLGGVVCRIPAPT